MGIENKNGFEPDPSTAAVPLHEFAGINEQQADRVVEMAYQNNSLRDSLDDPSTAVAEAARAKFYENERFIGLLAGRGNVEIEPVSPSPPDDSHRRRRVMQVVDPSSGRIVPFGQMRRGNHPQGGRIVGYR